jgi:hypothetical protein
LKLNYKLGDGLDDSYLYLDVHREVEEVTASNIDQTQAQNQQQAIEHETTTGIPTEREIERPIERVSHIWVEGREVSSHTETLLGGPMRSTRERETAHDLVGNMLAMDRFSRLRKYVPQQTERERERDRPALALTSSGYVPSAQAMSAVWGEKEPESERDIGLGLGRERRVGRERETEKERERESATGLAKKVLGEGVFYSLEKGEGEREGDSLRLTETGEYLMKTDVEREIEREKEREKETVFRVDLPVEREREKSVSPSHSIGEREKDGNEIEKERETESFQQKLTHSLTNFFSRSTHSLSLSISLSFLDFSLSIS